MNAYDAPGIGPHQFLYEVMCDQDVDLPIRIQAAKDLSHLLRLPHPVRPPFVPQRYQQCDLFDPHPHNHHFNVMHDQSKDLHQRIDAADSLMAVGLGDYSPPRALSRLYEAGMTLTEFNAMPVKGRA